MLMDVWIWYDCVASCALWWHVPHEQAPSCARNAEVPIIRITIIPPRSKLSSQLQILPLPGCFSKTKSPKKKIYIIYICGRNMCQYCMCQHVPTCVNYPQWHVVTFASTCVVSEGDIGWRVPSAASRSFLPAECPHHPHSTGTAPDLMEAHLQNQSFCGRWISSSIEGN